MDSFDDYERILVDKTPLALFEGNLNDSQAHRRMYDKIIKLFTYEKTSEENRKLRRIWSVFQDFCEASQGLDKNLTFTVGLYSLNHQKEVIHYSAEIPEEHADEWVDYVEMLNRASVDDMKEFFRQRCKLKNHYDTPTIEWIDIARKSDLPVVYRTTSVEEDTERFECFCLIG